MKKYISILVLVLLLTPVVGFTQTPPVFQNPTEIAPNCTNPNIIGCWPPINVSSLGQTKVGGLVVGGLRSIVGIMIGPGSNSEPANPNLLLDIIGNQPEQVAARIKNTNTGPNTRAQITLYADSNSEYFSFSRRGATNPAATGGPFATIFWNSSNSPQIFYNDDKEVMRITGTGDVGIGRSRPQAKLDVNGDICYVSGGERKCFGDGSVVVDPPPGTGDGIGSDILHTKFSGCSALLGCPIASGNDGPTQSTTLTGDVGTVVMTCPVGYKVVSGGAECDTSISVGFYSSVTSFLTQSQPTSDRKWAVQCTKRLYTNWSFVDLIIRNAGAIKNASITCAK
jgi:hypothetical protein